MVDFKHIDATAYSADQPLDTFLLVRNSLNLDAVRQNTGADLPPTHLAHWTPAQAPCCCLKSVPTSRGCLSPFSGI